MSRPKGSKLSPEHKTRIAIALKRNKNTLGKHWNWRDESRIKIKGRKIIGGEKYRFKKGQSAWNKGKKNWMSEQGKEGLRKANKSGKEAKNWIDGRSFLPYPIVFNKELKEKIKFRDKYTCQFCGVKEKDYFQKLSIHHLDYNKNNCNSDNLKTICRSCNAKLNSKRFREKA